LQGVTKRIRIFVGGVGKPRKNGGIGMGRDVMNTPEQCSRRFGVGKGTCLKGESRKEGKNKKAQGAWTEGRRITRGYRETRAIVLVSGGGGVGDYETEQKIGGVAIMD